MKLFKAREEKHIRRLLSMTAVEDEELCLEEVHGLLFGIAVTPEPVMPSEWIPILFGDEEPDVFDEKALNTSITELMGAYNRLISENNRGVLQFPFDYSTMSSSDFDLIEPWAAGFFTALLFRPQLWGLDRPTEGFSAGDLPPDLIDVCKAIAVIYAAGEPEARDGLFDDESLKDVAEDDLEAVLYSMIPESVQVVCEHGENLRREMLSGANLEPENSPARTSKVGRNEPCSCGSGKKYKKCCGST